MKSHDFERVLKTFCNIMCVVYKGWVNRRGCGGWAGEGGEVGGWGGWRVASVTIRLMQPNCLLSSWQKQPQWVLTMHSRSRGGRWGQFGTPNAALLMPPSTPIGSVVIYHGLTWSEKAVCESKPVHLYCYIDTVSG